MNDVYSTTKSKTKVSSTFSHAGDLAGEGRGGIKRFKATCYWYLTVSRISYERIFSFSFKKRNKTFSDLITKITPPFVDLGVFDFFRAKLIWCWQLLITTDYLHWRWEISTDMVLMGSQKIGNKATVSQIKKIFTYVTLCNTDSVISLINCRSHWFIFHLCFVFYV